MGFSSTPPRPDTALALRTIDLWAQRADAALILLEPPWAALLAGERPETLVRNDPLGLADYYRAKGLRIVASIDPTDGLDRSSDSRALVTAGRSLTDPAVRALYARYVGAFASLVRPEYLGVASETNLIRAIARPGLYSAVVEAAGMAAAEARTAHAGARLLSLPPDSILSLFAALGLVDVNLAPKPALAAWDATFRRALGP